MLARLKITEICPSLQGRRTRRNPDGVRASDWLPSAVPVCDTATRSGGDWWELDAILARSGTRREVCLRHAWRAVGRRKTVCLCTAATCDAGYACRSRRVAGCPWRNRSASCTGRGRGRLTPRARAAESFDELGRCNLTTL